MKRRFLAFFTALTLLLAQSALASQALGWELFQTETLLGPGVSMTQRQFWGDSRQDYRSEWYATYTPGQGSKPVVCYGSTVPSTASVTAMAKTLESYGGRVLAGTNGDYFVMASGVPLGLVVTDGVLRTSDSYEYAVGFGADGSAFVGQPQLSINADFHGYELSVRGGYNKSRDSKVGFHLYNSDFGATTRAKGDGVNVVLRPVTVPEDYVAPTMPAPFLDPEPPKPEVTAQEEDETAAQPTAPTGGEGVETGQPGEWDLWNWAKEAWEQEMDQWEWDLATSVAGFETLSASLSIGTSVTCVVEDVSEYTDSVPIPEGRFVMSIDKRSDDFLVAELASLHLGEQIELSVTAADQRWTTAQSALGAYAWIVQNGVVQGGLDTTAAPRTALGIKPDGQVVLYTIDGRRPGHSVGAGVSQVAKRLVELGCDQAVLFDGGGSTTFGATGALDSAFSLQNKPSEGSLRAVTNALFFVSDQQATGKLGSLYIEPHSALMLSGASLPLSCRGIDTGYYPMGEEPVAGVTYTAQGPGRVEGNTFIAGAEKGVATVTAKVSDDIKGTALMTVVDTPDTITLSTADGVPATGLNLDPGQTVALNASASWYKLPLLADDGCFTWSLSPEAGTVDPWGNLTAGTKAGSGVLTVSAGEKSASISITIGGHINTLADFEDQSAQRVKLGRGALELSGVVAATLELPLVSGESDVNFWFWSELAHAPALRFRLADGTEVETVGTVSTPGQWSFITAPIPETAAAVTAITPDPEGTEPEGVFYVDHMTTTNGSLRDGTPPTVQMTMDGPILHAILRDNMDKSFAPENVTLTLDGVAVELLLEGNTVSSYLGVGDGLAHRVSLTVRDASGNLTRASLDVPATAAVNPFADTAGHWAESYITYLAQQGVTNGRLGADGSAVFDPQTNITRGEFAAMLGRWLRADLTSYETAQLPFVDAAAIPSWALGAVGYLYDTGIMTGSLEADGLYANADRPLTRAQAMAMLGRVQAKGYTAAQELFADDDTIPDWAREHVYSLAGQGVVSGYEGLVRPQDSITRSEVAKLLTTLW